VLAVSIVVPAIRAIARGWRPLGDNALLLIRVVDVGTEHNPQLGSWSSSSLAAGRAVHNPGPIYFDLVAVPVKLFGPWVGVAIGVTIINLAAVLLAVAAARRIAGTTGQLMIALVCAGLAWTMGSELLFDIWQPNALVLPAMAFLVTAWGLAAGGLWFAPFVVGLASVLVQTHLSYLYVVALVAAWAVVSALLGLRRQDGDRPLVALPVAVSLVTIVLLWAQPLYQQFFGPGPGNLSALLNAANGQDPGNGLSVSLRVVSSVVALPPWWSRSSYGLGPPALPGTLVAVLSLSVVFGALGAVAWRARRRQRAWLASMAGVAVAALAASIVSLALTPSPLGLLPHQWRYLWPLAAMVAATLVTGVAAELMEKWGDRPAIRRRLAVAATLVVVGLAVANLPIHASRTGPTADRQAGTSARALLQQLDATEQRGTVLFDASTQLFSDPFGPLVLAGLQDRGVEFVVESAIEVEQYGRSREFEPADRTVTTRIWTRAGRGAAQRTDGVVLAAVDGLEPAERGEMETLEALLGGSLRRSGLSLSERGRARHADGEFPADPARLTRGQDVMPTLRLVSWIVSEELVEVDESIADDLDRLIELWILEARFSVALYAAPVDQRPDD
jgi:hypothetical protein